ncbi:hypothetical protein Tco_0575231 [Tanacetum coccineum]
MENELDISALTMEQYIALIPYDIKPSIVNPKIDDDVEFKKNANFKRELRRKLFAGTDGEDAYKNVRTVIEIVDIFHFPGVTHDAIFLRVFPITLKGRALRWKYRLPAGDISTRKILDSNGFIPLMTPTQALESIQIIEDHSHNWYDETTTRKRINYVLDNVDTIHESFKGEHLTKEYPLKKEDEAIKHSNSDDEGDMDVGRNLQARIADYDDSNDFYDFDQCEDGRNNEIRERIIHNLHEEWFKGTSDDEDDIEGIIYYLEPTSYDGFIDLDEEEYNKRRCRLLGMTYIKSLPIIIKQVKITRYSLGPGEVYTKLKVSNMEELPQTRNNVATIRNNIMDEFFENYEDEMT